MQGSCKIPGLVALRRISACEGCDPTIKPTILPKTKLPKHDIYSCEGKFQGIRGIPAAVESLA